MKRLLSSIILIVFCVVIGFCGINRTLNAAQGLYENAKTIKDYQDAKRKFQSAKSDVGYVAAEHEKAINAGINNCDKKISELSPRLTVNGNSSSTDISFSASGGNQTLSISTNQGNVNASALPSWITVNSASSTSMSIYCSANTSTSSRNDWFDVNAGTKTVRVNVRQSGKAMSSSSSQNTGNGSHSANIESVWIEQNVTYDGKQGIYVHAKFTVAGMNGKDGKLSTYYYDSSNNAIKDLNGSYCTNGDNPSVAASVAFTPEYDNSRYNDCKVFIPYSELHQSGTSSRTINVSAVIWDYSDSSPKQLARKDGASFSYTPKSDSYLTVDSKTAVSTTFSGNGGSETFYVSTDADSWTTWGIPSWCRVTDKTSTSFKLVCEPNTSSSSRSDYMKIKTGNHEVRIDITQNPKPGPTATIENVWVDHNAWNGMVKGMKIHIKLRVAGYKGKTVKYCVFFYQSDNSTKLVNMYGNHISQSATSTSDYEDCTWNDWWIFVPYANIFGAVNATGRYSFDVEIQTTSGTLLVRNENNQFYQY